MNSEMNNMDQWLKQTAELGMVPYKEADWQHMKQLLQPKKKRRFIIFWWLLTFFLIVGTGGYFFVTSKSKPSKTFVENKENQLSHIQNSENAKASKKNILKEADSLIKQKTNNDYLSSYKNASINNTTITNPLESKKSKTPIQELLIKKKNSFQKKALMFSNNYKLKTTTKAEIDFDSSLILQSYLLINNSATSISTPDDLLLYKKLQVGKLALVELHLDQFKEKNIDSITSLQLTKDSSNKYKQLKQRHSEWVMALGYSFGGLPIKNNSVSVHLGYSYRLKQFSINPSVTAQTFNPVETQQYNGVTEIKPVLGTAFIEATTKQVTFKPSNGFVITPTLSIGYEQNKWKATIGASKGFVVNRNNINLQSLDTFKFYTATVPPSLKVTDAYDPAAFNGKQFTSLELSLRYKISKTLFISINYATLLWNNSIESIIDEKRKRTMLGIRMGICF